MIQVKAQTEGESIHVNAMQTPAERTHIGPTTGEELLVPVDETTAELIRTRATTEEEDIGMNPPMEDEVILTRTKAVKKLIHLKKKLIQTGEKANQLTDSQVEKELLFPISRIAEKKLTSWSQFPSSGT